MLLPSGHFHPDTRLGQRLLDRQRDRINLPTFGAANAFAISSDIVINEIMYSAPPTLEVPASGGNPRRPLASAT